MSRPQGINGLAPGHDMEPSQARLAGLLADLPNAVLCLDRAFRFTYANAEARRISRLTDEMVGSVTHWELFPDTVGTEVEVRYRRAMEAREPAHFEYHYEPFGIWLDIHVLITEEGIALYYQDITARKQAEAREAQALSQLRHIFDATPDGIVLVSKDWRFTYANPRALEIVGKSDIVGHNIFELFPGNLEEPFYSVYQTAMNERIPSGFEAFHTTPLNLWLKVEARPHDEGIVVYFSDVTQRKESELREQATAARLAEVLEVTSDSIASINRDWQYTFMNRNARRLLQDPDGKLIGKVIWEAFPAAVGTPAWTLYHRSMDERVPGYTEIYYPAPVNAWLSLQAQPSPDGIVVFFRDITEQKTHDAVVQAQQELLAVVQRAARMATWEMDPQSGSVTYGPGSFNVLGHPLSETASLDRLESILLPGQSEPLRASLAKAVETGDLVTMEFGVLARDGSEVWVESRGQAVLIEDGTVRLRGMSIDTTQRKLNERRLIASEERYRVLADLNPMAIWMGDPQGNITYANQGFLNYIGLTQDDLGGAGWVKAFAPSERNHVVQAWTHCVQTGEDYDVEALMVRKADGAQRYWHLKAAQVRDANGKILHWLGVAYDIHDAKTYAASLRAEQIETERRRAELETLYATTPVGLALLEPEEFRILNLNDHEAAMLGDTKAALIGRRIADVASPAGVPELLTLLGRAKQGELVKDNLLEGELVARPGEKRAWSVNYAPVFNEDGSIRAISTASIEITNQKKAESALIQSEKLAAVGRLASSISHEINNPLEAITNLLFLIGMDDELPEAVRVYVHMAQSELSRVSQIATQTLRFHRQAVNPTHVTAKELVGAVIRLYTGRLANSGIKVDERYDTETKILCFENDIRQVLNNLIANAIDAMRSGGRLIVRAHATHSRVGGIEREGVRITVADTGHGMSAQTQARIFEPFYTTKDLNGTGLGLWISSGIVDRHEGRLTVRSSEDPVRHGTIFTLFLPCAETSYTHNKA